jgi:hypothetical protein
MMRILLAVVLLGLVSCEDKPKFKKGDCIVKINTNEFKELHSSLPHRVLVVGESNYKAQYHYSLFSEMSFSMTDKYYKLSDSSVCEAENF